MTTHAPETVTDALAPEQSPSTTPVPLKRVEGPSRAGSLGLLVLLLAYVGLVVHVDDGLPSLSEVPGLALVLVQAVGVVAALFGAVVGLHELGHLVAMRRAGLQVSTLAVGLGPRLLAFQGPQTRYQIGLLPIGGYARSGDNSHLRPRTRAGIALAGPVVNLALAALGLAALLLVPMSPSLEWDLALGNGSYQSLDDEDERYAGISVFTQLGPVSDDPVLHGRRWPQTAPAVQEDRGPDTVTTFTFRLPLDEAPDGTFTTQTEKADGTVATRTEEGRLRLTHVEMTTERRLGLVVAQVSRVLPGEHPEVPRDLDTHAELILLFLGVNLLVGLVNLLPLLPLDGGHIALEGVTALNRGRRPKPRTLGLVTLAGLVAVLVLDLYMFRNQIT